MFVTAVVSLHKSYNTGVQQPHIACMGNKAGLAVSKSTKGECLPGEGPGATFLLPIPTSAPNLPSHGEAPQVDHIALHTFPTKHVAK